MFRASSAHLQEVNDVNCTCMQPLVFSFSAGGRLVHVLRGDLHMCKFKLPTNDNAKVAAVRNSELEEHFTGYFVIDKKTTKDAIYSPVTN